MLPDQSPRSVMMLGTFGMRPKATMRSRALALAQTLLPRMEFSLVTTPWDHRDDAGKRWTECGIDVVNTRAVRPVLFPLALREMLKEFNRRRPDLVHLFKPKGFGDLAARRVRARRPVVVDMDDWEGNGGWNDIGGYGRLQRTLFDWQERTWPRQADAVTVASRELERRALSLGADPATLFYVPNGLTRARYDELARATVSRDQARYALGIQAHKAVLLYTRFVEFDPRVLVEVMLKIRHDEPTAMLVVAGASANGRPERALQSAASAAGVADSIRLLGWVDSQEVPGILASADVAIHPFDDTIVNRAKCSVKLLELMATGLPVVTNCVGENAQMIEQGRSGVLVDAGDVSAMAAAVAGLLNDRQRADAMGSAARARVERDYLWESLSPGVEAAYSAALHRFAARSG